MDNLRPDHLFGHHGWVPVGIWIATAVTVVTQDLLFGVGLGLTLSILEIVPYLRRKLNIERREEMDAIAVDLDGAATAKDVPSLIQTLEGLPPDRKVRLAANNLHFIDHTSAETISDWLKREARAGRRVGLVHPPGHDRHKRVGPLFRRFHQEAQAAGLHP
ncbi:STAS domain-containing protein [Agrobacterium sp. B1(2019)]|uniref:STAS domain-containing protein n=1 Tax=Agrobacterium sp. B1(2019) TaxID=2607032 RepID=UPI0011EC7792|nr:STAS domain-containing protein [Agrobacterium sp. B1(2019)]TZG33485.1 hypothetical protein AGR1_23735 [Agrobacterium sp. B1(2019)]